MTIRLTILFEHASYPVDVDQCVHTSYRMTDVAPYTSGLERLEAKLRLLQSYYRSRFGHDFDFSLLNIGD